MTSASVVRRYSLASAIIGWATPFGVLIALCFVLAGQPLATNDGPVHVSFADLIANLSDPVRELQRMVYVIDLRAQPNLIGYLLMAAMTKVMSAQAIESVIQLFCLCLPAALCWLALRTIRSENAWLAIFVLPLSLNQNFFLGLYNCCLSTAMIFAAMALFWHLNNRPSVWRGILLGAVLSLTLMTHPAGFVGAQSGIAAMAAWHAFRAWRRGSSPAAAIHAQRFVWLALSMPVALLVATWPDGPPSTTAFGSMPWARLAHASRLELLRLQGGFDAATAFALSMTLGGTFAWVIANFLRRRDQLAVSVVDAMYPTLAALAMSILVLSFFPDTFGGGWAHVRRFAIFPFFWLLAALALHRFGPKLKLGLMVVAAISTFVLYALTLHREALIRHQMAPLVQADDYIGTHCTVLPLVLQSKSLDDSEVPRKLSYHPFFQAASRFELRGDRVVLFNYLARLDVYPVKFRSHFEPQANLFHWEPMQQENIDLEELNVADFERNAGLHVDYVLLVGSDPNATPNLRERIAASLEGTRLAFQSADQRIQLFERQPVAEGSPVSHCIFRTPGDQDASVMEPMARDVTGPSGFSFRGRIGRLADIQRAQADTVESAAVRRKS